MLDPFPAQVKKDGEDGEEEEGGEQCYKGKVRVKVWV